MYTASHKYLIFSCTDASCFEYIDITSSCHCNTFSNAFFNIQNSKLATYVFGQYDKYLLGADPESVLLE